MRSRRSLMTLGRSRCGNGVGPRRAFCACVCPVRLALVILLSSAVGCGATTVSGRATDASIADTAVAPSAMATNDSGDDASADAVAIPLSNCKPVIPSNYDQSCAADSDCVLGGQVLGCPASLCDFCELNIVGRGSAQYMADLAAAAKTVPAGGACGCGTTGSPCCRGGVCVPYNSCAAPADTLPVCADAGGTCVQHLTYGIQCEAPGPSDACAYSDEICCLDGGF
jgi:hypothetical protein